MAGGRSRYWSGVFPVNGLTPLLLSWCSGCTRTRSVGLELFCLLHFHKYRHRKWGEITWWSHATPEAEVTKNVGAALYCGVQILWLGETSKCFLMHALRSSSNGGRWNGILCFISLYFHHKFLLTLRWTSCTQNYSRGATLLLSWRTIALHQWP